LKHFGSFVQQTCLVVQLRNAVIGSHRGEDNMYLFVFVKGKKWQTSFGNQLNYTTKTCIDIIVKVLLQK
jgi:hypothetical protein